jgi:hypothetical protein
MNLSLLYITKGILLFESQECLIVTVLKVDRKVSIGCR